MPSAEFKFVVSSSESETGYGAENLLTGLHKRTKWKGKAGAEYNAVVLQLEREYVISSVHVGNEFSALIEILVSRSCDNQRFYTLIPAISFMDPKESRSGKEGNRVRIFTELEMVSAIAKQKWDVVKVLCTQPFNSHISYGLSFVNVSVEDAEAKQKKELPKIALRLKKTSDDPGLSLCAGDMFKRRETFAGALATDDAKVIISATPVEPTNKVDKREKRRAKINVTKSKEKDVKPPEKRIKVKDDDQKIGQKRAPFSVLPDVSQPSTSSARQGSTETKNASASVDATVGQAFVPFHKILEGVNFSLSGYVNPPRTRLREKALDMGARYRGDWCPECTHLVCAFSNTPKWQQVCASRGTIVTGKWIEACYTEGKRLPEKQFPCR